MISETKNYFSKCEVCLWCISIFFILVSFFAFDHKNYLTLTASIIGVTSLVLNAKANPAGPALMIVFSFIYAAISFKTSYYGEMITYLFMTMPMSVFALVSWLKNPFNGNKSEVRISSISHRANILLWVFTVSVTGAFYFVLKALNTANLILSTVSVATSFVAVSLTFLRSPYYALGYAANDLVLIALWICASVYDLSFISVTVCFVVFFANDIYGFLNWKKIKKTQDSYETQSSKLSENY